MRVSVRRWLRVMLVLIAGTSALCLVVAGETQALPVPRRDTAAVAVPASALASPGFTDSFGTAVDDDPGYGLNDSLTARQSGARGITYTRVSGLPSSAPAPPPWYSQVNHVSHPGVLSFWLGTSAVRMDAPVAAGQDGTVAVQASVDPVTGDTSSSDWSSLVLSTDAGNSGWVAGAGVALGVLVRSNGGVQVFQNGTLLLSRDNFAQPAASGQFVLGLAYTPGQASATISVNGVTATVPVQAALPASASLFLGADLSNSREVTTLSDLEASAIDAAGLTLPTASGLRYYGYYAARLTGASHLAEVAGRSNLNWVNISDVGGYAASVLAGCAPGSCVVNTGNEFFSCDSAGNNCVLYPDYQARWANLAAAVRPYLDKIAAFYILDEPQWHGATPGAIQTSAQLIKSTFPGAKVMMIEAGPEITSSLVIPSAVDWVGFDWYCQPFSTVQQTLGTLESLTATSGQGLFLVPEDAPLSACAGVSGHETDADIAALQWRYYDLAVANPRVIGLMNFGFWTSPAWTNPGGTGASSLPLTVDANERVAARILADSPGTYDQYSMMSAGQDGSAGEWYVGSTPQSEWAWHHTSATTADINWGSPQYWPQGGPAGQPSDLEHFSITADSSGTWVELSGWSHSVDGQTSNGTDYTEVVTAETYQPGCTGTPQSLPVANGEEKYALYSVPTSAYCLNAVGYITSPQNSSVHITFEHWQAWSYGPCSDAYYTNQVCIEQHEKWSDDNNPSHTMTQTLDRYGWLAKGLGWFKSVNGSVEYDGRYFWTW